MSFMNKQANPVQVELTRAGHVESRHRGSIAIVNTKGELLFDVGDIKSNVFPRSAIKAFQATPLVMHPKFDETGLRAEHIALACASHGGEADHIKGVEDMLALGRFTPNDLECGAHYPLHTKSAMQLFASGEDKTALHNNCSGKHSAMLHSAKLYGFDEKNYISLNHPLQELIKTVMQDLCEHDLSDAPCGCDGCSVPTWGMPLKAMAFGMARLFGGDTGNSSLDLAGQRIAQGVREHPFMVAGSKRFCTQIMTQIPRVFAKTGAEGVYCGAIPQAGIGIAVKCDDGASRAAEIIFAAGLVICSKLLPNIFSDTELAALSNFCNIMQTNWNGIETGILRSSKVLST